MQDKKNKHHPSHMTVCSLSNLQNFFTVHSNPTVSAIKTPCMASKTHICRLHKVSYSHYECQIKTRSCLEKNELSTLTQNQLPASGEEVG